MDTWIRATPTGTRLDLRVIPRARKDGIDGLRHGCLLNRKLFPIRTHLVFRTGDIGVLRGRHLLLHL